MALPAHIKQLESESIFIFRELIAECERPVLLYSIGKDSAVLLHLALKAFHPGRPPFPLLHVDTGWKFREMIAFRDETAQRLRLDLRIHTNSDGAMRGISPFVHGSAVYTEIMKTEGLRQALDAGGYDCAIGGARRDEESSRAKERVFSMRAPGHRWDPKQQRPELWRMYNGRRVAGGSVRVFPLSNWTELDIWTYIDAERIPVVPLYFAKLRPIVERGGMLVMVDDTRMPLAPGEEPQQRLVRFRTLGCYPLTGAVESEATTVAEVIAELQSARTSERQGRAIDRDSAGSMEKKKRDGYF
jgi:sulfate adenylyltransferase subunit 2